jgi:hypothetical protein
MYMCVWFQGIYPCSEAYGHDALCTKFLMIGSFDGNQEYGSLVSRKTDCCMKLLIKAIKLLQKRN